MERTVILFAILAITAGCQVSHPATVMYSPQTGDRVVISHHGTTGKLGSALAARYAHEADVEELKKSGYIEAK
jgi:hypothetical protein